METTVPQDNQPQLSVVGAWTKAGVASCIHVKGRNKVDDILLDCGTCEPSTFSVKAVLITHGHIDHAGCCINHARGLALSNKSPTYFVPSTIVEPLTTAWHAYEAMNEAEIPMDIQTVKTDDAGNFVPFFATPNIFVRPFHTEHRVPSHGYALYSITKGRLLPEYAALPQEEIAKVRKSGVVIKGPDTEQLELVYTGDTLFSGLLRPENAFIFQAPILIMELTYLDGKREKAIDRTHVHLDDVIEHAELFQNRQIIFVHISQKYSASIILEILRDRLPVSLIDRVFVNLTSFGVSNEHLTPVNDRRWAQRQRTEAGWGWSHPTHRYHQQQQQFHKPPYYHSANNSNNNSSKGYRYQQQQQQQQQQFQKPQPPVESPQTSVTSASTASPADNEGNSTSNTNHTYRSWSARVGGHGGRGRGSGGRYGQNNHQDRRFGSGGYGPR